HSLQPHCHSSRAHPAPAPSFRVTDTPSCPITPLSLHDALPISPEHTLTIELERNGRKPVYLFVDESRAFSLKADDKVLVRRSKQDRKSTRLNSSHVSISYAVFCLKEKNAR